MSDSERQVAPSSRVSLTTSARDSADVGSVGQDLNALAPPARGRAEAALAQATLNEDNCAASEIWLHQAYVTSLEIGDDLFTAGLHAIDAQLSLRLGDLERSVRLLKKSRLLADDHLGSWSQATLRLTDTLLRVARTEEAAALLTEVETRSGKSLSTALRRLTRAIYIQDPKLITSCIYRVRHYADPNNVQVKIVCHLARGAANIQLGHPDRAAKAFRKARYLNAETLRNPNYDIEARLRQAEALIASGAHPKRALEHTTGLIERLDEVTQPLLAIEIYRIHAAALRLSGRTTESDAAYAEAVERSRSSDHVLYRYLALRDHARSLLLEAESRPESATLLESVVVQARGCIPAFDHPCFGWEVRVYEVLTISKLAYEQPIGELEACRRELATARANNEMSEYQHDLWTGWLTGEIDTARRQLREALVQDVAAMDEVVAGLRSEDPIAHLARFTESIAEQLGAERAAMVLEGDHPDTFEVIAAHGMEPERALELTRTLLSSDLLTPDQPALVRDTSSSDDPVATVLRRLHEAPEVDSTRRSLDDAIVSPTPGSRSAMAFAIDGAGVAVGLIFADRPLSAERPGFRTADLRDFAFLANGLAAVSRIALSRAEGRELRMRDRLQGVRRHAGIVTRSVVLGGLLDRLERAAVSDLPILVTGESGTGKELFARAIHESSKRSTRPFLTVNCAAIPEPLLEAELFGHTKGAFTGADHERAGYFRDAAGGTIFLDEIGEMPSALQAKLLRVLEDRRVTAVGSTRPIDVDFRIVSATNVDLDRAIKEGAFRADLYYRLEGVKLALPALRERPEDILLLLEHFTEDFAAARDLPSGEIRFTAEARRALERYEWPGNVRELRQTVHSAAAMRDPDAKEIDLDALPSRMAHAARPRSLSSQIDDDLLDRIAHAAGEVGAPELLFEIQERLEARAIHKAKGNKRAAARSLSMGESTLRRRLKVKKEEGEDRDG